MTFLDKVIQFLGDASLKSNAEKTVLNTEPPPCLTTSTGTVIKIKERESGHKWLGCMFPFFFPPHLFPAEGLEWRTVLLGSLQAMSFPYRRLRMCMKGEHPPVHTGSFGYQRSYGKVMMLRTAGFNQRFHMAYLNHFSHTLIPNMQNFVPWIMPLICVFPLRLFAAAPNPA